MDVRNADVEPTVEHGGTCLSYFMLPKESFREQTEGSYLEFVGEFELKPGSRLHHPHHHDSHEFYYLLSGEARAVSFEPRGATYTDAELPTTAAGR